MNIERTWRQARLNASLRARGHDSALVYARARPGISLVELAEGLGPGEFVAIQLLRALQAEASDSDQAEWLARDLLAREIREEFGDGWPRVTDERTRFRVIMVLSSWKTDVPDSMSERAERMTKTFLAEPPPEGWKPEDGDDPVIRGRF